MVLTPQQQLIGTAGCRSTARLLGTPQSGAGLGLGWQRISLVPFPCEIQGGISLKKTMTAWWPCSPGETSGAATLSGVGMSWSSSWRDLAKEVSGEKKLWAKSLGGLHQHGFGEGTVTE